MTPWSQSEKDRTIDEVKRKSEIDDPFRALALSDASAPLAKVNPPPPLMEGSIRLVETASATNTEADSRCLVIGLPKAADFTEELSDDELEDVAGGLSTPPVSPPPPPVGLS